MKKLTYIFLTLALIFSHSMCAVVAFNYRSMLCGAEHLGFSAPASTAFLLIIPFAIVIAICLALSWVFYKKGKTENNK